jgi:YD repeat-containing protein
LFFYLLLVGVYSQGQEVVLRYSYDDLGSLITVITPKYQQEFTFDELGNRIGYEVEISDSATFITEISKDIHYQVFPNPTNGEVYLKFNETIALIKVTIRDVLGKVIQMQENEAVQQLSIYITAPPSIYLMEIKVNGVVLEVMPIVKME